MKLFDEDVDRSNRGPARYAEPHFGYLNRSGRREAEAIRTVLEAWFALYPQEHKGELRARLRSPDETPHLAAFFELYLHELLRLLGYQVQIHPTVAGSERQPDFQASKPGEPSFYLEAITATNKSAEETAAEARLNDVYDALNKVRSPNFFIRAQVIGAPRSQVPTKRLKGEVERFLAGLDPDEVKVLLENGGLEALPTGRFEHDGWEIEYSPLPKSPKARGDLSIRPLGIHGPQAGWVDDSVALRDAVIKKAARYGDLGAPYVVAVNAVDQHLDTIDIMDALFGKEVLSVPIGPMGEMGEPISDRRPDGALIGPKGPINTRVSAVLVAWSIMPWSVGAYSPILYHNPWAKLPCLSALTDLHVAAPTGTEMKVTEGRTFADLAGLPPGWPNTGLAE